MPRQGWRKSNCNCNQTDHFSFAPNEHFNKHISISLDPSQWTKKYLFLRITNQLFACFSLMINSESLCLEGLLAITIIFSFLYTVSLLVSSLDYGWLSQSRWSREMLLKVKHLYRSKWARGMNQFGLNWMCDVPAVIWPFLNLKTESFNNVPPLISCSHSLNDEL